MKNKLLHLFLIIVFMLFNINAGFTQGFPIVKTDKSEKYLKVEFVNIDDDGKTATYIIKNESEFHIKKITALFKYLSSEKTLDPSMYEIGEMMPGENKTIKHVYPDIYFADDIMVSFIHEDVELKEFDTHFRNLKWGMNLDEVKKNEKVKLKYFGSKGKNIAYYLSDSSIYISGVEFEVFYIFTKNKLVRAKYISQEKHTNENEFLNDYDKLSNLLTKKYGGPIDDKTYWLNSLYKDKPEKYGFAVSLGHLAKFQNWETKNTNILMMVRGENYKINMGIEYVSKKYKNIENESRENESLNDL